MKQSRLVLVLSASVASMAASASASWVLHTGPGPGAAQPVKSFTPGGATGSLFAYDASYTGGVRVAAGDLNGDGASELITGTQTAPAGGGGPHVKVFDGSTGAQVRSFFPFEGFTGGVTVAAGDINGDGRADIITGAGANGHVKVFDGDNHNPLRDFFAFGTAFTGGVNVAADDINGDGRADIITGVGGGSGGGPVVRVFSGQDQSLLHDFFATTPSFTGGVFVAAGDINNDGSDDIIVGLDTGGLVSIFSGRDLAPLGSFNPYGTGFTGGVRVATGDLNGDGIDDIITGTGTGGGGHVKVFDGATRDEIYNFFAYDPNFTGGVFVAAGQVPEPALAGVALLLAGTLYARRWRVCRRSCA